MNSAINTQKRFSTFPIGAIERLNQPQPKALVRFGKGDTAETTASLPSWTQKVKDPPINWPQFLEECNGFEKKYENRNPLVMYWGLFKLLLKGKKLKNETQNDMRYLPKEAQQDLKKYHRTLGYWRDRIFNPKKVKLMDAVYQGPMSVKAKQQAFSMLPFVRENLKTVGLGNNINQPFLGRLFKSMINRELNKLEVYKPLLNNAPPLPYSMFEKQINELKNTFNKKHTDNPITTINKEPIGTGSIGQVYKATTKNGRHVVLKVVRPNLTESFLNDYLPYAYYKNMVFKGVTPQSKQEAAQRAEKTVALLKGEANPEQEAKNTQLMRQQAALLNTSAFQIPEVLEFSKTGLIMPFLGEKDLVNTSPTEQATTKNKMAPDLTRFLLLSNAKPLDLHDGNVRTGDSIYWIDHGRQININKETHQKFLQLMISAYRAPKFNDKLSAWDRALLCYDTRQNFRELLALNSKANTQAIHKLEQIETMPGLQEKVTQQAELQDKLYDLLYPDSDIYKQTQKQLDEVKQTLKPFNESKTLLSQALGQPEVDVKKPQLPIFNKFRIPEQLTKPSVLNAWASSAMNIPGFTQTQIPQDDIRQYRDKSLGFLAPYLSYGERTKKIDQLSLELSEALAQQSEYQLSETEKKRLFDNMRTILGQDLSAIATKK